MADFAGLEIINSTGCGMKKPPCLQLQTRRLYEFM